jgi:hypothetical protein
MSLTFNNRLSDSTVHDSVQVAPNAASGTADTKKFRSAKMLFTINIWIKISNYVRRTHAIVRVGGAILAQLSKRGNHGNQ